MKRFARISSLLSAFLLACTAIVTAQGESKCNLKLAQLPQAPEQLLRGFHLGMTIEQFRERAPKLTLRPDDALGFAAINIYPAFEAKIDKATFEGVRTISIEFIDGRISSLWINYDNSFKWKTLDEIVAGMTEALRLPRAWQSKSRGPQLVCSDFQISVSMVGGSPSVKLSDEAAKERLETRRAEMEEKVEQQEKKRP